jgi:hypothetical protein
LIYTAVALKQDRAGGKLKSVEEDIDVRRVVDSKLYDLGHIIIRSS